MANWKEYTTKTTPEDADEIMIADSKANVSKRTPFSGLWNWIAGKLASAVIAQLETANKSIIPAINELNSNKVSYAKYEIINPAKEFSLTLDNASIYLVCYAGIDTDNVKNIGFSVVVSRSSSSTKGGVLNIKSEIPQVTLSLKENVLKCTPTVWLRIFVIKL